jgi:hypothetical protein
LLSFIVTRIRPWTSWTIHAGLAVAWGNGNVLHCIGLSLHPSSLTKSFQNISNYNPFKTPNIPKKTQVKTFLILHKASLEPGGRGLLDLHVEARGSLLLIPKKAAAGVKSGLVVLAEDKRRPQVVPKIKLLVALLQLRLGLGLGVELGLGLGLDVHGLPLNPPRLGGLGLGLDVHGLPLDSPRLGLLNLRIDRDCLALAAGEDHGRLWDSPESWLNHSWRNPGKYLRIKPC